jgi:glutamine amidotransferase
MLRTTAKTGICRRRLPLKTCFAVRRRGAWTCSRLKTPGGTRGHRACAAGQGWLEVGTRAAFFLPQLGPSHYLAPVIALIDYGSGNLRSVHKALLRVGAEVRLARQADGLKDARAVVLPGVGAFDDCIQALDRQGLLEGTRRFIESGRPFLGICVGYQALFERSEEFNSCAAGLSIFQGKVVRFAAQDGLKVPQIGWNQLEIVKPECPLFRGVAPGSYVYFVHSFFPKPIDESIVATRTTYGETFASSVWHDNVFATQFHPEKSQKVGLQLLRNFVELANGRS